MGRRKDGGQRFVVGGYYREVASATATVGTRAGAGAGAGGDAHAAEMTPGGGGVANVGGGGNAGGGAARNKRQGPPSACGLDRVLTPPTKLLRTARSRSRSGGGTGASSSSSASSSASSASASSSAYEVSNSAAWAVGGAARFLSPKGRRICMVASGHWNFTRQNSNFTMFNFGDEKVANINSENAHLCFVFGTSLKLHSESDA